MECFDERRKENLVSILKMDSLKLIVALSFLNGYKKTNMNTKSVFVFVRDGSPCGRNFKDSKYPFWRTNPRWMKQLQSMIHEREGRPIVLCFIGNQKKKTDYVLGFALYEGHHDIRTEPTKPNHMIRNEDQGWEDSISSRDLHIDYTNKIVCDTERIRLPVSIPLSMNLIEYEKYREFCHLVGDLHEYYQSCQEPALIFPIIHSEEDPLEEEQRKLEEEEASLQLKKYDLEKRKMEKEYKKWVLSEDAFQCYQKAYSEELQNSQKEYAFCHMITNPTKEMWNDLLEDRKRHLYSHYLISINSQ
jgi:hypothetical protein